MTTNADLIREARDIDAPRTGMISSPTRALVSRLADALEAAEAMQREYLNETVRMLGCLQHIYDTMTDASLKAYAERVIINNKWPADLLEAVRTTHE